MALLRFRTRHDRRRADRGRHPGSTGGWRADRCVPGILPVPASRVRGQPGDARVDGGHRCRSSRRGRAESGARSRRLAAGGGDASRAAGQLPRRVARAHGVRIASAVFRAHDRTQHRAPALEIGPCCRRPRMRRGRCHRRALQLGRDRRDDARAIRGRTTRRCDRGVRTAGVRCHPPRPGAPAGCARRRAVPRGGGATAPRTSQPARGRDWPRRRLATAAGRRFGFASGAVAGERRRLDPHAGRSAAHRPGTEPRDRGSRGCTPDADGASHGAGR